MVETVAHLSEAELEAEYVACSDARRSRHLQTIRLLAKGRSVAEVSTITACGKRWIGQLRARYNADGLAAPGDQRRGNGTTATILTETVLAKLPSGCGHHLTMAGCGRAAKSPGGWQASWAWPGLQASAVGRR